MTSSLPASAQLNDDNLFHRWAMPDFLCNRLVNTTHSEKRIAALILAVVLVSPLYAQAPGKTLAQKLVDETLASHPEMATLVMHVTPPDGTDNVIIASNIGRIGKKADEDDIRVINTGKPNLEANKSGDRFGVELVFLDSAGDTIGALAMGFRYKSGDDIAALQERAEQIRDELRKQIPARATLFEPVR